MDAKEKSINHFNEIACDYNNSSDGKFVEPMYEVIVAEIEKSPSGRILDVGCGNGNLFNLLSKGKYELFGIDFSQNMIEEAKSNCANQASFLVGDAEQLPFDDDTFDIVVCNASFHHYIYPEEVLRQMHRVLKKGGKLLIGDPYLPGIVRPVFNMFLRFSDNGDYHIYGFDEIEKLLSKSGFALMSSVKMGNHTAFHTAEKCGEPA